MANEEEKFLCFASIAQCNRDDVWRGIFIFYSACFPLDFSNVDFLLFVSRVDDETLALQIRVQLNKNLEVRGMNVEIFIRAIL